MGPPRLWVPVTLGVVLSDYVGVPCLLVLLVCDPVHCDQEGDPAPPRGGVGKLTGEGWSSAGPHSPAGSLPSAASLSSPPNPHLLSDFPELPDLQKLGLEASCLAPWPSWYGPKVLAGLTLSLAMWMESPSLVSPLGLGERSPWRGGKSK